MHRTGWIGWNLMLFLTHLDVVQRQSANWMPETYLTNVLTPLCCLTSGTQGVVIFCLYIFFKKLEHKTWKPIGNQKAKNTHKTVCVLDYPSLGISWMFLGNKIVYPNVYWHYFASWMKFQECSHQRHILECWRKKSIVMSYIFLYFYYYYFI